MPLLAAPPDVRALVDPLLGAPYEDYDCWGLVRTLLKQGFALDIDRNPQKAAESIVEVWFRGDARNPLALSLPWDFWIMATRGTVSSHIGIVIDSQYFVHTRRKTGVVLERLTRWQPRLLQLGRLRVLV
jgi:cell wall-associated NlpC family hydrolase